MTDAEIVAEARALLERAERAEGDSSAWKWDVADHIVVLRGRGWSRSRIGEALGMSGTTAGLYERMVDEYSSGPRPRFGEAQARVAPNTGPERNQTNTAKRALRDPVRRKQVVAELTSEQKVALAGEAIADDPDVAEKVIAQTLKRETRTSRRVRRVVRESDEAEREAERRFKREQDEAGAPSLPNHIYRMLRGFGDTARGMQAVTDDELAQLSEHPLAERLAAGVSELVTQAHRWSVHLSPGLPAEGLEDGSVIDYREP